MSKIQMTEEQADNIYDDFLYKFSNVLSKRAFVTHLKKHDYIEQSAVEKAKDNLNDCSYNFGSHVNNDDWANRIVTYYIELEKEIERLKGDKN